MAMFGALPAMSAAAPGAMDQMAQMMPRPKKTGMFGAGKGNIGEIIAAALSGALAARGNPAGQMGLQMLHQRRQQAAEQEQYGQRREDEFQDWVRKQAYQAANPNPVNNDTANDYRFISERLGEDAAKEWLRNQGDPLVTVNLPGSRVYSGPRSQLGRALGAPAQGPQPGHVEDGFRFKGGNPADPNAWEPMNGGPTPQASGGFQPGRY